MTTLLRKLARLIIGPPMPPRGPRLCDCVTCRLNRGDVLAANQGSVHVVTTYKGAALVFESPTMGTLVVDMPTPELLAMRDGLDAAAARVKENTLRN